MTAARTAVAASLVAALALSSGAAPAKDKMTFAYLLDPAYDAVVWPIKSGKVKSDLVEIDATALDIPALLQATGAKTYDIIMTAAIGMPAALERGLQLRLVATGLRYHQNGDGADVWVKSDSPIKSVDDLKGKTIGAYSLRSTGITLLRIGLWKKYGLNVALEGGDMKWVEMPAPQLPAALASNNVGAATLIHSQAYKAAQGKDFRSLVRTAPATNEVLGGRAVSAVHVGYPEKLNARPAQFKEMARLLKASVDYTLKNQNEVFAAVAKETNTDVDFFRTWFTTFSEAPMAISDNDVKVIQRVWEIGKEMGLVRTVPQASELVWEGAVRE
jgi:NitT/TauT family transport system substrate-binding protein